MAQHIIIIGGPTASGKSGLALRLAMEQDGVVINADSMQVYAELPILTAQPPAEDQAQAPHRLYGFLPAAELCTVARWLAAAKIEIDAALASGKTPIVVGGTGLYFKCLTEGIASIPEIDEEVRAAARKLLEEAGNTTFHRLLQEKDPVAAANFPPGDSQRMLRAWEVVAQTGVPIHAWQQQPHMLLYPQEQFRCHFVNPPREELYKRCDTRFLAMLEHGAMDEVRALAALTLDPALPAMKALGVPELTSYNNGEITLEEATVKAQQATRNYAKRQVTWFKNQFPEWEQIVSTP